jgi:hypothetical protein
VRGLAGNTQIGETLTPEQYLELGHIIVNVGASPIGNIDEEYLRKIKQRRRVEVSVPSYLPGAATDRRHRSHHDHHDQAGLELGEDPAAQDPAGANRDSPAGRAALLAPRPRPGPRARLVPAACYKDDREVDADLGARGAAARTTRQGLRKERESPGRLAARLTARPPIRRADSPHHYKRFCRSASRAHSASRVEALLLEWCRSLENASWARALSESGYAYPLVEGSHVMALALSVGTVVWFDLRLLGWTMRDDRVSDVFAQVRPWMLLGFAIMVVTGVLLFATRATDAFESSFFRLKLSLLALGAVNIVMFHTTVDRRRGEWDSDARPPLRARLAGAVSLVLWFSIIAAGRIMAYNL